MKKIVSVIVVLAIVAAGVVFVPKLVHKCDDCGEVFVGVGYEPMALSDLAADLNLTDKEMEVICEECAEKHHAAALLLGKELDEFKLKLFD